MTVLSKAPLVKGDIVTIDKPFSEWSPDLDRLPHPVLLHLVAFQPGGFDVNNPDYFPPDSKWGTTEDLRRLVEEVQEKGSFVIPYTNPTWWDEKSSTLEDLPSGMSISDIAVQDKDGKPVYEEYNGHKGIVVSPGISFVRERLDRLMEEWQSDVPVDCIFLDQVGVRNWLRDFNPAAPDPLSYSTEWLGFTRRYADRCLMTEMGWDRLAETMVAFHGSVLTWERTSGYASQKWGRGNWGPYPLALWLFHDKVLMYQHNLDGTTMAKDSTVLTWDIAFGMMLSYVWETFTTDTLENPWLDLVALLQRKVAALYAGKPLADYEHLLPHVTRTRFDDLSVTANWHSYLPYRVDGYDIAVGGFLARTEDGSLLAGAFPGTGLFNGQPLSPGDHYIVVQRSDEGVTAYQPVGEDTRLYLDVPEEWSTIKVTALDTEGTYLEEVDYWHWPEEGRMSFFYRQELNGLKVGFYRVMPARERPLLGTLIYPQEGWGLPTRYTPAIGFYDSSDTYVLDRQIAWMRHAGIDFALWQWIADQGFSSKVIDLYKARSDALPWAVQYESKFDLDPVSEWRSIDLRESAPGSSGESRGDRFVHRMNELIEREWVTDDNYFTVDGRPVVYLWAFSYWRNWASYVDRVFADYHERGLEPPFFIGVVNGWATPETEPFGLQEAQGRIAAFFAPIMVTNDENLMADYYGNVRKAWQRWKEAAEAIGSVFIPTVTAGFDYTAVNPESPVLPREDGETLRRHYELATKLVKEDVPLVINKSWNDYPEGDSIEPSLEYGTSHLETLKELRNQR